MKTITERLAACVRGLMLVAEGVVDGRTDALDAMAAQTALTAAHATLEALDDTTRPLEVGDRVVVVSNRYSSPGLNNGSKGTIARMPEFSDLIRVQMDTRDDDDGFCSCKPWGYLPSDIQRIPTVSA